MNPIPGWDERPESKKRRVQEEKRGVVMIPLDSIDRAVRQFYSIKGKVATVTESPERLQSWE